MMISLRAYLANKKVVTLPRVKPSSVKARKSRSCSTVQSLSDSALFLTDGTFHKQKSNECDSDDELGLLQLIFMQFDSSHVREQRVFSFAVSTCHRNLTSASANRPW